MKQQPQALSPQQVIECSHLLTGSVMFKYGSPENLARLCEKMQVTQFTRGEVLMRQGDRSAEMLLISEGSVTREREAEGQLHKIDTAKSGSTVGAMHLLRKDPCYATAQAATDGVAYSLDASSLKQVLEGHPPLANDIIYSLTREVREMSKQMRTPLLEQHPQPASVAVISIAASIESFYRSALNSLLNARLTGVQGALFPNMHVQIPTRMLYINGVKGVRNYLEANHKVQEGAQNAQLARVAVAIAPGLCMTPVSNVLEAANAGHTNSEPLWRRSLRGTVPRAGREIVFGVGLNQLSDFCEERALGVLENRVLANAAGSMLAGVIAGYFSHVPHNLATLKLLYPQKSYREHFWSLVERSKAGSYVRGLFPASGFMGHVGEVGAGVMSCIFPKGVVIRTTQIVGTFIILNGMINVLKDVEALNSLGKL